MKNSSCLEGAGREAGTTSPHMCLGRSCAALSVTSRQGMHLSVSPRQGAPDLSVKEPHILSRKSPWQDPGSGSGSCRAGTADVRRHRAELAAGPTHVPFLEPLPAPPQGSLLGQSLPARRALTAASSAALPTEQPRVWGRGDRSVPGGFRWNRAAAETTSAPTSPGTEDLSQIPSTRRCLKDPTMTDTPAPLCLGSEVPHCTPQGIFLQHRMTFPKQLF